VAASGAGAAAGDAVIGWLSPQSADDDYKIITVPFVQGPERKPAIFVRSRKRYGLEHVQTTHRRRCAGS
jgi:hypothetical protein